MRSKNYAEQIERALRSYETYMPYHQFSIEWISDRIAWCWKFKHISEKQMNNFCDRIIRILEEG